MGDQSRIIRLFQAAQGRGEGSRWPSLLLLMFLAAFLASVLTYVAVVSFYTDIQAGAGAGEIGLVDVKAEELEALVERQERIRLYAEKLPIEHMRMQNMGGELTVTGRIVNRTRREVGDIELAVYIQDGEGKTIARLNHTAASSDGLPLKLGQYRKFSVKISPVPDPATEVLVLVTDIAFEGE